jgi:hypothetical protein
LNVLSTIGEAVKTALAGGTFNTAFDSIQRVYVPEYPELDPDTAGPYTQMILLVVGLEEKPDLFGENSTRVDCEHDLQIRVAMMKRITAGDVTSSAAVAEMDALSDIRQQVLDLLKTAAVTGATLKDISNSPAYDPAALDGNGVWVSVFALTYQTSR